MSDRIWTLDQTGATSVTGLWPVILFSASQAERSIDDCMHLLIYKREVVGFTVWSSAELESMASAFTQS